MTFSMLAGLLVQFGPSAFDLAQKLVSKWNSTEPVTLADIEKLRAMGKRSGRDALVDALVRANIPLDSPQAVALLALAP